MTEQRRRVIRSVEPCGGRKLGCVDDQVKRPWIGGDCVSGSSVGSESCLVSARDRIFGHPQALLGLPKSIPDQSYADPHCGADSKRDSRSRGHEHQLA